MIPNTTPWLVFIRASIWSLRSILPVSIAFCLLRRLNYASVVPWPVEGIAWAEVIFYFFVSLPIQRNLNRSRPRETARSRSERQALYERSFSSIPDVEAFLSLWFRGARLNSIRRQDVLDLLAWCFLYKTTASKEDEEELESYLQSMEQALGWTFPPGKGPNRPSQSSTDALTLLHKPLVYYVIGIAGDDVMNFLISHIIGLRHYRLPMSRYLTVFPFRPHSIFTPHVSPAKDLSYWYRPHTSKTRKPVLFIHGIGVGMRTYTTFLDEFIQHDAQNSEDGQVGIIAIEIMAISMRITKGIPPRAELLKEIVRILDHHGWDKFVVMGHSYGTIIATHIIQELGDTGRVGPILLVDPVTIFLHWGNVPYNFIYRRPRKASEWQLYYFASTEKCIAHSITRQFDWTENVLWSEDMQGRTVTVVLAEEDIIMDTRTIAKYLEDDESLKTRIYNSKHPPPDLRDEQRDQVGLDVIWYDGLNHAGVFYSRRDREPLVKVLWRYCGMEIPS